MEAPRTPVQWYALIIGGVLTAIGVLSLILGFTEFGTANSINPDEFVIWQLSGWNAILYIAFGAAGLFVASRVDAARAYALVTGVVFAAIAVWGFIDGNDVFNLLAVDTTDNISNAVVGGLGLLVALPPERRQRAAAPGYRRSEQREHGGASGRHVSQH